MRLCPSEWYCVDGCGRDHHVFCETSSDWILFFFFDDTEKGGAQLLRMSMRRETERGRSQRSLTQTDGMPQAVEVTPTHKLGERKSPFVVAAQAKKDLRSGDHPNGGTPSKKDAWRLCADRVSSSQGGTSLVP